ncbi:nitrite reductase small subunit NirD [Chromobacterium haemolyticum]|uniref:Nitrite reductase small subunit NirD n=1 Tax=Chromobacterium fluminis TaxID=3044269 RepID=A0ABX0LBZ4_9NEIS|nr:nitrite reductase small subunit NirD [Chromobacterium haemolyticum]NHR08300.1 nitrite reductase small subunit NirD [Chromobacterium haemolyticum]
MEPTPSPSSRWLRVCALDDIPLLGSRVLARDGGDIALFRPQPQQVFALLDRCPHKGGPLSQGLVHGAAVTCPLHGWTLNLDSGEAQAPDRGCARRFPVSLRDGDVYLQL